MAFLAGILKGLFENILDFGGFLGVFVFDFVERVIETGFDFIADLFGVFTGEDEGAGANDGSESYSEEKARAVVGFGLRHGLDNNW